MLNISNRYLEANLLSKNDADKVIDNDILSNLSTNPGTSFLPVIAVS